MPPRLQVETLNPQKDTWIPIGIIAPGDRDGTVSDNLPNGRDIYLFGVDPIENKGYIKKSVFGADLADDRNRVVTSAGFTAVAWLNPNESFELAVKADKSPEPRTLRFTYFEE